jgi:hypothetical protein
LFLPVHGQTLGQSAAAAKPQNTANRAG